MDLATEDLPRLLRAWAQEGVYQQLSVRTTEARRSLIGKLIWFLEHEGFPRCGEAELRGWLEYIVTGHTEKGGRWGLANARPGTGGLGSGDLRPSLRRPPRPSTTATFHTYARAFFSWCVDQGILDVSPMTRIKPPPVPKDQVDPWTPAQIDAMVEAARKGPCPARDQAIIWLLYDTGLRAEEVCGIRLADVDLLEKRVRVLGKGGKERTVSFGLTVGRALWAYLRDGRRDPTSLATGAPSAATEAGRQPLLLPENGGRAAGGDGLTARGLYQVVRRTANAAGIERRRCGPHTFRNTFAVEFLADGGSEKTCQEILGHSTLAMTHHYAKLAGAHIAEQHRQHSPADRHRKKGDRKG